LLPQLYVSKVSATSFFSDGLESGDFNAWTGTYGDATVTSGNAVEGNYKAVLGSSHAYFYKLISNTHSKLWVRVYVNLSAPPPAGDYCRLIIMGVQGVANIAEIAVRGGSPPQWACRFWNGTYTDYITSTTDASVLTYHCLEMNVNFSSTSGQYDGAYAFYVDGSELTDLAGTNCDTGSNYVDTVSCDLYAPLGTAPAVYYDSCTVADSYIGPIPEDTAAPTFGSIGTNTTVAGRPCAFNCLVNDNTNVSTYIFSTNNTGAWTNDTAVVFSSFYNRTAAWANVTKMLNDTVGNVINYMWYANDTSNNWSSSDQYDLTLSALQHYLTVTSPYGTSGGQGWYDNGSTAYATLDTGIVDHGNGTRRMFTSWGGDASGTSFSQSDPIAMDGNKTAIAVWKTQYYITFAHSGLDPSGSGEVVTVNGTSVNYAQLPYSFWADSDSIITYSYDNVSSTTSGKRFILTGVSGPLSPITVTEPTIITGDYGTQYEVTFDQTGVETDFTGTVATIDAVDYGRAALPVSFWWDKDSNHNFSFNSQLLVNTSRQYEWNTTSGLSTLQSETLTITAPGSIIGNYLMVNGITFDQIGVNPDFAGTVLEVDGNTYTANMLPVSFMWEAGSVHNFTFFSPLVVNSDSKRYVWTSATGLSQLQSDTITVTTYGSIIANYKTQYFLTVTSSYGTVNGGGWYDDGATAYAGLDTGTMDHGNGTRRVFVGWTGDASGSDYLQSNPILMDGLKNAVANWKSQCLLEVLTVPIELTPQPTRDPVGESGSVGWWYDVSVNVSLTASDVGFASFERWDVDGVNQSLGVNPITLTIDAPHIATAHYLTPDIAVESVVPSKTVVGQGYSMVVNATVTDLGFSAEIFNITVYANNIPIVNQTVILSPGDSLTAYFTWNTSGLVYGNYTISACAWPVHNEINIANNNCTSITEVHVGVPGDVSSSTPGVYDKKCDMKDIAYLVMLFNTKPTSPNWNPNADVDNNGVVNMRDIAIAILNFNLHE